MNSYCYQESQGLESGGNFMRVNILTWGWDWLSVEFVWMTRAIQNIFSYMQCCSEPMYIFSYYYQESQVLESGSNFMIVNIVFSIWDVTVNRISMNFCEQRNMEDISAFSLI